MQLEVTLRFKQSLTNYYRCLLHYILNYTSSLTVGEEKQSLQHNEPWHIQEYFGMRLDVLM